MELNIFFIVYRESFEAILILSIVWSILNKASVERSTMNKVLSTGTVIGFVISGLVAIGLYKFQEVLPPEFLDYFNYSILLVSSILITQMCIWMAKHSKDIKGELQKNIHQSLESSNFFGIIILVAFSIAREGIETVLFLSGAFLEATGKLVMNYSFFASLGFIASLATLYVFLKGFKLFKPKYFFMLSTFFLFLTASSFVIKLSQGLIMAGMIPPLKENLWDSTFLIDETSKVGGFLSSMTGYHATPHLMTVILFLVYWVLALGLYQRANRNVAVATH